MKILKIIGGYIIAFFVGIMSIVAVFIGIKIKEEKPEPVDDSGDIERRKKINEIKGIKY